MVLPFNPSTEYKGANIQIEKNGRFDFTAAITGIEDQTEPIIIPNLSTHNLCTDLGRKLIDDHEEKEWFYKTHLLVTKRLALNNTWSYNIYHADTKIAGRDGITNTAKLYEVASHHAETINIAFDKKKKKKK